MLHTSSRQELSPYFVNSATAYINAGGRGTRISPALPENFTDPAIGVSKALLEVGGQKTFLVDHHIRKLLSVGMHNIVAGVGDHGNVKRYVDFTYRTYPNVSAIESPHQRGTGGDLIDAVNNYDFFCRSIFVNNVDTILDIDEADFLDAHHCSQAGMTIALTQRTGVPNEGAFSVNLNNKVIHSAEAALNPIDSQTASTQRDWNGSSTGAVFVEKDLLQEFARQNNPDESISLYRDIIAYALGQSALYAYNNQLKYFLDVGTVDTWHQAEHDSLVLQSYISS
jgi:NDP-sugar pyrophosphorylase family protein